MNPGEQESFLTAFWLKRDPTPGTGRNEAREEFMRRIDLANRAYGARASVSGMFSDMGRVFIRYGEPSEVLKQVVPSGDNTLTEVIRQLSLSEDREVGEVHQKGLGGDMRPYEVWIYEGDIPLPPDTDPTIERNQRRQRLIFLFVDDQGTGDYRLRYSTE
jgi:GWxTD domain-containing protein